MQKKGMFAVQKLRALKKLTSFTHSILILLLFIVEDMLILTESIQYINIEIAKIVDSPSGRAIFQQPLGSILGIFGYRNERSIRNYTHNMWKTFNVLSLTRGQTNILLQACMVSVGGLALSQLGVFDTLLGKAKPKEPKKSENVTKVIPQKTELINSLEAEKKHCIHVQTKLLNIIKHLVNQPELAQSMKKMESVEPEAAFFNTLTSTIELKESPVLLKKLEEIVKSE